MIISMFFDHLAVVVNMKGYQNMILSYIESFHTYDDNLRQVDINGFYQMNI